LSHPLAALWLQHLSPHEPAQHRWMEHGSFDFCLENAALKLVQLGLHGGLPQVRDAVGYYLAKMEHAAQQMPVRQDFVSAILTANVLSLLQVESDAVSRFMLQSLEEMADFAVRGDLDIYLSAEERRSLTGIPACWTTQKSFIKPELIRECGYAFPLLYDIVGMHSLYRLGNREVDRQIDTVVRWIAADAFHLAIDDGYGILVTGKRSYLAMGWDPKCPGWCSVTDYIQNKPVPQLLLYALHASRYPAMRQTGWYGDFLKTLEGYRTVGGRYAFPAPWLLEAKGYAVLGRHLSFGENRRKKNWREIESTFYMHFLRQPPQSA
ncbi:MAG: hypothetical protein IH607_00345, partial [Firmicutes bacterium]|nr:hypothetical protein [Bacillota bacterium]